MKKIVLFLVASILSLGMLSNVQAHNVYLMNPGNSENLNLITTALTSAGLIVTQGLPWYQQNGAQSLSNYDAVVFLPSYNWNSASRMPVAGQNEILQYILNGGGLVTTEWFVWDLNRGSFSLLGPLSPVTPTSSDNSAATTTYTKVTSDPILNDGVADSFTFTMDDVAGTETVFTPQPGATTFYSSSNGGGVAGKGGVIGGDYGSGKVISFSTLAGNLELQNDNYKKLFVNSVEWATGDANHAPEPASMLLLGSGIIGLLGLKKKKS